MLEKRLRTEKRIIFFTLDLTLKGGIERVVCNLSNFFSMHLNYKVIIVSVFKKNPNVFYQLEQNVEIIFLNNHDFGDSGLVNKIKAHVLLIKSVLSYLNKAKDAIIISTLTNISIYLALFSKKGTSKIIAAEHSQYFAHNRVIRLLRIFSYKFVDKIVTLTLNDKQLFLKYFTQEMVERIANPLSFYPEESSNIENKRIISIGRLVPDKDFGKLIEAFSQIASKNPEWILTIVGDGEMKDVLSNQIESLGLESSVKLLPSSPKIQNELLTSSIYVCSSRTEAFPMALMEAMACGLPIVSFDCPVGPREIITNGIDGILVSNGNVEELAIAMNELILNRGKRITLSKNAKENIKIYKPEMVCRDWVKLFNELN